MKEKEQLPGWPRGLSRKLAASYTRSEKDFARFLKALLNSAGPDTRWDVEHPEFFCWAGAWMAGERVGETSQRLFVKYLSLYTDQADSEEIVPRGIPGIEPQALIRTLSTFYGNIIQYDLVRQWIVTDGPFHYDFEWLSQTRSKEDIASWAGAAFKNTHGVHPDDFEISVKPDP
jgi:hypothetical protein